MQFSEMNDDQKATSIVNARANRYSPGEMMDSRLLDNMTKNLTAQQQEIMDDPRRTPEQKAKAMSLHMRAAQSRQR